MSLSYSPENFNKDIIHEAKEGTSENNMLTKGKLRYLGGKNEENLYYTIEKEKQQIRCFKNENSTHIHKTLNLKGAKLAVEPHEHQTELKLVLKSGKAVIFSHLEQSQKTEFKKSFLAEEFMINSQKKSNSIFKKFKSGFAFILKVPIKMSSGTINVLEKIGDGFRKTPDVVFSGGSSIRKNKIKKIPKGPAQGVYFGAESIVNEVAGALVGLFSEPMKGAKEKGIKGATAGLGKGIAGLIFKPVAGTIDLVTYTARGVGTVPRVIYKDVFRIKKKKKGGSSREKKEIEKDDLELVYENEKEEVYVNKKRISVQGGLSINNQPIMPMEYLENLDHKERLEQEKLRREKLKEIMINIIGNLDVDTKISSKNVIPDDVKIMDEEEKKEVIEEDNEISEILDFYQNEDPSQDSEEKLYEFFFVQNIPNKHSGMSFQTNSFDDKPPEKFFNIEFDSIVDQSEDLEFDSPVSSESYNLELAVNKPIAIDDSDEFDADEFNECDIRVAKYLPLYTGRDGRNGPISPNVEGNGPLRNEIILGNILDDGLNENFYFDKKQNLIIQHNISELERQNSMANPHILNNSESYFDTKQRNSKTLQNLIPEIFQLKLLRNWKYPEINIELPFKELEDLPDLLRIRDYEFKGKQFCQLKGQELIQFLESWNFIQNQEDVRHFYGYKKGGKVPESDIIMKKLRVIAKEFLMKVGRSVLTGNFNLTQIPFPIKFSIPKSYFENIGVIPTCFYPLYLNLAMKNQDPLQRFKFYLVGSIAYYFLTSPFAKPFNPILGETFTGYYNDGSKVYCEQISHHPQVSYLLYLGPKKAYKIWGPSNFSAHASLNSLNIITKGWRKIEFSDTKQTISNSFPNERYEGLFWGTTVTETIGSMEFNDEQNQIYCKLTFGGIKKKPSDYFEGSILVNGKKVSHVYGTYLGWTEIDQFRYFDYRHCLPFELQSGKSPLLSDFRYRADYLHLKQGYVDIAQQQKENLEKIQRNDAKLRKEYSDKKKKKS